MFLSWTSKRKSSGIWTVALTVSVVACDGGTFEGEPVVVDENTQLLVPEGAIPDGVELAPTIVQDKTVLPSAPDGASFNDTCVSVEPYDIQFAKDIRLEFSCTGNDTYRVFALDNAEDTSWEDIGSRDCDEGKVFFDFKKSGIYCANRRTNAESSGKQEPGLLITGMVLPDEDNCEVDANSNSLLAGVLNRGSGEDYTLFLRVSNASAQDVSVKSASVAIKGSNDEELDLGTVPNPYEVPIAALVEGSGVAAARMDAIPTELFQALSENPTVSLEIVLQGDALDGNEVSSPPFRFSISVCSGSCATVPQITAACG